MKLEPVFVKHYAPKYACPKYRAITLLKFIEFASKIICNLNLITQSVTLNIKALAQIGNSNEHMFFCAEISKIIP